MEKTYISGLMPTQSNGYSSLIESVNTNNIIELNNELLAIAPISKNDELIYSWRIIT